MSAAIAILAGLLALPLALVALLYAVLWTIDLATWPSAINEFRARNLPDADAAVACFDRARKSDQKVRIYDATGAGTVTGQGYELHGCFIKALSLTGLNTGEIPAIEITIGVSWWQYAGGTFPSVVAQNAYSPAPVAAGSFFLNTVGTTTRAKRTHRSLSIDWTLGVVPLSGPGGANQYQTIVGARRTPDSIKLSWTEDAAAGNDALWTGTSRYHACITLNAVSGSAVGFYMPNLCITGARPMQMDDGGINRQKIEAMAYTGPTTTSDLTLSAIRMAFA